MSRPARRRARGRECGPLGEDLVRLWGLGEHHQAAALEVDAMDDEAPRAVSGAPLQQRDEVVAVAFGGPYGLIVAGRYRWRRSKQRPRIDPC